MRTIPLLSFVSVVTILSACSPFAGTGNQPASSSSSVVSSSSSSEAQAEVAMPKADDIVTSPLTVRGKAMSSWFFEGSLPVVLVDIHGNILAQAPGTALTDWTMPGFVEFQAELTFENPTEKDGELVIKKDNPSGLPENDGSIRIPVHFE